MTDAEAPSSNTRRLAFNVSVKLRNKLTNVAHLLQKSDGELAIECIDGYLDAIIQKRGDKFQTAMEVLSSVMED